MMDIIYKRIREQREKLNMTQMELAEKLGYKSRSSINKIELGLNDLPQSKIAEFADALHTTPGYLLGLTNDDSNKQYSELLILSEHEGLIDRVRKTMSRKAVNIFDMSFGTDLPIDTITKLLDGDTIKIEKKIIQKIADYLEVDYAYLIGWLENGWFLESEGYDPITKNTNRIKIENDRIVTLVNEVSTLSDSQLDLILEMVRQFKQ